MLQTKSKILYNKKVKGSYFHLALEAGGIARGALPGQFIDIRIDNTFEPLLRRPFSIHRIRGKSVEILYEVVGKGTDILSEKKPGEILDVVGPLGSGFTFYPSSRRVSGQRIILVGGGMGVAPLMFLAEKIAASRLAAGNFKSRVLIGARTKNSIVCENEFKKLGYPVDIATDDGSRGFRGTVTCLLKNILQSGQSGLMLYACGPRPMLKEISIISQEYGIPAQISLEEHMACGIGACLGCVINTKHGLKRVCKEGPVFAADEISWG